MERSTSVALALLGLIILTGASEGFASDEGSNLLLNPGAEAGQNGHPSVWFAAQVPADGLRMWQDLEHAHEGRASLAIANTHDYEQPVSNNWAQDVQTVPTGQTVVLAAYIRTENADAANVCVQCWDLEGKNMLAFASTPVFRGSQDWVLARANPIVVPEDTKSIIVRAALTGKGRVWFDDLTLATASAGSQPTSATAPAGEAKVSVDEKLREKVPGRIIQVLPVRKDCMVLSYIPQWSHGNIDNIAVANNDGGVRTLVDWGSIPAAEARREDRRFLLALYSRETTAKPSPGAIQVCEILGDWPERTPWASQPRYAPKPVGESQFEPDEGWKIFDVTSLVRDQAKAGRRNHGVMLRFSREDRSGNKADWSGYAFASRECPREQGQHRPVLLVVEPAKPAGSQPAEASRATDRVSQP